jgi:hypothetical protein
MTLDLERLRAHTEEYDQIATVAIKAGDLTKAQTQFVQKYMAEVLDALPKFLDQRDLLETAYLSVEKDRRVCQGIRTEEKAEAKAMGSLDVLLKG